VRNEFGRLDGLVHAAALLGERAPIEHHDVVTWMKVMHVNVNAAFILTQALLPLLRLSEDASVIFTTSGVSDRGRAYWGAYAVSKFACEGLMQVLADETGRTTHPRQQREPGQDAHADARQGLSGEDPRRCRRRPGARAVPVPARARRPSITAAASAQWAASRGLALS
jgi:NAD(P)-dependent dehydrogenase (short-subunit alcohol dehydrogenase family)